MAFSFPGRVLWILLAISLPLWACGTRAPYLNPVTPGMDSSNGSNEVVVEIKPVDTSGFRNPEQERLGVDLSAYYTAFEVTFRNGTSRVVNLDSRDAVLLDDDQKTYTVLSAGESLDYYQSGGMPGEKTVVIPKSLAVAKDEMKKIRQLRLKSGEIPPGGTETGFLLFRKVPADKCHQISLSLRGVRISGEDRNREFRFGFSCPGS